MGRSGKWLGVAVGVVAIALTIVGFVGPWWNVRVSGSVFGQSFDSNADFRLFGGTATATAGSFSQTNTTDYSEDPNTRNVFLAGAALSGLAIVVGAALVALAAMANRSPTMRRGAAVFGILAFVLGLASVLYVMSALPSAVNADTGSSGAEVSGFWGTDSITLFGSTFTMTWAAGWPGTPSSSVPSSSWSPASYRRAPGKPRRWQGLRACRSLPNHRRCPESSDTSIGGRARRNLY